MHLWESSIFWQILYYVLIAVLPYGEKIWKKGGGEGRKKKNNRPHIIDIGQILLLFNALREVIQTLLFWWPYMILFRNRKLLVNFCITEFLVSNSGICIHYNEKRVLIYCYLSFHCYNCTIFKIYYTSCSWNKQSFCIK